MIKLIDLVMDVKFNIIYRCQLRILMMKETEVYFIIFFKN